MIENLKHLLPERLHDRYISQEQIGDTQSKDLDLYTVAHILVGERHGKFDLVNLVAYLLHQIELANKPLSTEHGPWLESTLPDTLGEHYCSRCYIRFPFAGQRPCEPHKEGE